MRTAPVLAAVAALLVGGAGAVCAQTYPCDKSQKVMRVSGAKIG